MIQICENALPEFLLKECRELEIPWYLISTDYYAKDKNPYSNAWVHLVIDKEQSVSPLGLGMKTLALTALEKTGQNIDKILRIRLGLHTIAPKTFVGGPHVDQEIEHQTALIYLDDSDGNTTVYDQQYDPTSGQSLYDYYQTVLKGKLTTNTEITPYANKMIWFNGLHYHSSSNPTKSRIRRTININYTIK